MNKTENLTPADNKTRYITTAGGLAEVQIGTKGAGKETLSFLPAMQLERERGAVILEISEGKSNQNSK